MKFYFLFFSVCALLYSGVANAQCFWGTKVGDLDKLIWQSFDPNSLPTGVLIKEEIKISKTGRPQILKTESNGSKCDEFRCEQAIWEAAPFKMQGSPPFFCSFSNSDAPKISKKNYPIKEEKLSSESTYMFLIPYSVLWRYPKILSEAEIHSTDNMVLISVNDFRNPRLNAFREEWCKYFEEHDSSNSKELKKMAASLRIRYSDLIRSFN